MRAAGGPIDLLVNNAGGLGPSPLPALDSVPVDVLVDLFTTNVAAPLGLIQAALDHLAPGAVIVNITSDASVEPYPGWGVYGTTKAALDHLGAVLAVEHPELRVLTVDPGDMRTHMHQEAFPGEDISDRPVPEERVPAIVALIEGSEPVGPLPGRGGRAMTTATFTEPLRFDLPPSLEATEPPELTLGRRDAVRLMVSRSVDEPVHAHAHELARFLDPGDLVVINTSATVPAAVDAAARGGEFVIVHFSTELPTGLWLVELRRPVDGAASQPHDGDFGGTDLHLPGRATVHVLGRMPGSARLWVASLDLGEPVLDYLHRWGRAIRYHYVPATWPIDAYRNAYATEPGSAEMPSAGRPLTPEVLTSLVARGVGITPLVLHTGVASLEGHEMPYPEHYRVPVETAARINATHAAGRRVMAIGTTVVRALETVTDGDGRTHPGQGWTDLVITPERGVRAVDGLLTGWHEPEASHLQMLEAVAGRDAAGDRLPEAIRSGYRWHEFGDSHLLLPAGGRRGEPDRRVPAPA